MASQKMTLLEMVQDILSDMDSDSVNSVSDTTEALQVAGIVKSTYMFMINNMDCPWLGTLFQLESAVAATPTKMKIPDDVSEVLVVKYDCRDTGETTKEFKDIKYKHPDDFLNLLYARTSTASTVTVVTENSVPLLIRNDVEPSYWTSFDDEYIIMDSYDSVVESNLQSSKSACHGYKEPTWSVTDGFTPDLPSHLFPRFLAEAKAICMVRLKQTNDPTSARQARAGQTRTQYSKWRENRKQNDHRPDFGRK